MDTLRKAIEQNLITLDAEQKQITYVRQNKRRGFQNPEEKVQAETFCKLVLEYGYSAERIEMYRTVKMGVSVKEADIIVYADDERSKPYIVVECKSPEVSEMEFKQAVEQAFSYAHAIAGTTKFIWVTKGNKEEFYRFDKDRNKKMTEADIPYFGERATKKYRYAKGGYYRDKIKGKEERVKTDDISSVTESELTRIFKQAHDALWAGGELNPSQAFDELDKLIFCKVWDERNTKKGEPYQFQIFSESDDDAKNLEALRKRIFALYDKGKDKDPEIFNRPIELSVGRIKTVVEYFQSISFSETDLDSKGKAFETFLGAYFRGEFGQYFTPRNVVKFAVEALPITNESRVLDTSCGSGGFLLYVLDKVRRQADREFDLDNPKEAIEHYNCWHAFAEKNLFGIEINDQISRVAKMNMIIHDDGHTNVVTFDGLYQIPHIAQTTGNRGFAENSFDFIVTNPPFGSIVKQSEKSYMQVDRVTAPYYDFALKEVNWIDARLKGRHTTTGRENQSTEILFIEQCHKFLKEGGYLAIVIPDGILTNSSSQYVRDRIEEGFRVVGVVSLPQTAFTNTGAGVKSSVLFLKKHARETTEQIRQTKFRLQDSLAEETSLVAKIETWERERKELLKPLKAKDEATESKKRMIAEEYGERIGGFKEELDERYQTEKRRRLLDYPVFMAIAENIGYDAAGKPTYKIISREEYANDDGDRFIKQIQENDLFTLEVVKRRALENGKETETTVREIILPGAGIVGELRRFIEAIESGQDSLFRLSPPVNPDKIFLVQKGEIESRLDATAYKTAFNYTSSRFQIEKLAKVAFINPQVTFEKLDIESEISFVPMEVVDGDDGTIEELRAKKVGETKGFTRFQENDLIWAKITPCMQNGKSAVARNLKQGFGCGSTEFYVIRPKTEDVLVDYLHFLLRDKRVLENAQNFFGGSAGQQRVSIDFLRDFKVPIPPKDVQLEIVEKIKTAYAAKRAKEAEARAEVERAKLEVERMILGETSAE